MRFENYLTSAERQAYALINHLPPVEALRLDAALDRAARERGWMGSARTTLQANLSGKKKETV